MFIDGVIIRRRALLWQTCLDACEVTPFIELLNRFHDNIHWIESQSMAIEDTQFLVWIDCARRGINDEISGCVDRIRYLWMFGMVE